MGRRRLPTGGLSSLAVVLAALAVIVVAGAPPPARVLVPGPASIVPVPVPEYLAQAPWSSGFGRGAVSSASHTVTSTTAVTPTTSRTVRSRATTSHQAPPTTTTTSTPVPSTTTTTTTTLPATGATSRTGVFEGGATSATTSVGAARSVTVSVPPGIRVTLLVTCGLWQRQATAMTSATVHVDGGGATCEATFSIPTDSPQPAAWRLAAT